MRLNQDPSKAGSFFNTMAVMCGFGIFVFDGCDSS